MGLLDDAKDKAGEVLDDLKDKADESRGGEKDAYDEVLEQSQHKTPEPPVQAPPANPTA